MATGQETTDAPNALSVLGYGGRPELDRVWQLLEAKQDASGRYCLEARTSKPIPDAGKVGTPNRWVTLYVCLAQKYRMEEHRP